MPWTKNLSVGVDIIDEQHKTWFEKADQLFEAGRNNKAKDFIGELLDFLDDYTKKHFSDEEKYMIKIKYPEYYTQKKLHTEFIANLSKLKQDFEKSGKNISVIINANQMVLDWLINHISVQDKKIGQFVRKQNQSK